MFSRINELFKHRLPVFLGILDCMRICIQCNFKGDYKETWMGLMAVSVFGIVLISQAA